jgi:hypothetical protein
LDTQYDDDDDDDETTKLSPSYGFMHDLVLLDIHPLGHREVRLQLLLHTRLVRQFELEL